MKVTILHIMSVFFAGFALMFSNYEVKLKEINKVPSLTIQNSKIDSLENVCKAKQKEVNKELENSISILQDSQAYILQCIVGVPLGFDSLCPRNNIANY